MAKKYEGVKYSEKKKGWRYYVKKPGKKKLSISSNFLTEIQAAIARDYFIIKNKLDEKINKRNFTLNDLKKARKEEMKDFFNRLKGSKK